MNVAKSTQVIRKTIKEREEYANNCFETYCWKSELVFGCLSHPYEI